MPFNRVPPNDGPVLNALSGYLALIDHAFQHVVAELNAYLNLRSSALSTERVVMGNLLDQSGSVNANVIDRVVLSLVNVEEERIFRSVDTMQRQADGRYQMVRPEVRVNLYALFIANLDDYSEALKALSNIISFFQHRPYFEYASIPALATQEGRLIAELHSPTFEQINHLWGALGVKYLPSVMYKMRVMGIRDEQVEAVLPPVEEIRVQD